MDYEKLLRKYMYLVASYESVTFLDLTGEHFLDRVPDMKISNEEWAELRKIEENLNVESL